MKDKEKPSFASLNPSLLARKGGARPAMRPQLQPLPGGGHEGQPLEDLGWNDMGHGGDERHSDPLPLTPAPASPEANPEAETPAPAAKPETVKNAPTEEVKPTPSLATAQPREVHRQREAIAESISPAEPAKAAEAQSEPVARAETPTAKPAAKPAAKSHVSRARRANGHALDRGKRAAFTLRLDQSRHLKLRLACTINNRSAQQIVTDALDTFLEEIPELDSLAAKVNRR